MRVLGSGPSGAAGLRRSDAPAPGASGFAALLGGREAKAEPARAGPAGLAAVGGLLALQAAEQRGEARRRALRRGHALLDRLEELRLALLGGGLPPGTLRELRDGLARRWEPQEEPGLDAVLAAIELRVAVELAKLEREGTAAPAAPDDAA